VPLLPRDDSTETARFGAEQGATAPAVVGPLSGFRRQRHAGRWRGGGARDTRAEHRRPDGAELALHFPRIGPVVVFAAQRATAPRSARLLTSRCGCAPKTGGASDVIGADRQAEIDELVALAAKHLGAEHELVGWLPLGIAYHHARVPEALRRAHRARFPERRLADPRVHDDALAGAQSSVKTRRSGLTSTTSHDRTHSESGAGAAWSGMPRAATRGAALRYP